jgi:hypothetical protein
MAPEITASMSLCASAIPAVGAVYDRALCPQLTEIAEELSEKRAVIDRAYSQS